MRTRYLKNALAGRDSFHSFVESSSERNVALSWKAQCCHPKVILGDLSVKYTNMTNRHHPVLDAIEDPEVLYGAVEGNQLLFEDTQFCYFRASVTNERLRSFVAFFGVSLMAMKDLPICLKMYYQVCFVESISLNRRHISNFSWALEIQTPNPPESHGSKVNTFLVSKLREHTYRYRYGSTVA
mmetsp:Transcript_5884/g.13955  ORF Transcript_5884/g.13955 Transcript_5884/m.13955 type:complete len:183 (-) Transcript_5884:1274-1822(-)